MKIALSVALLCLALAAAGCGQKGPLLQPDAVHKHKRTDPPSTPAPAPSTAPGTDGSTPSS